MHKIRKSKVKKPTFCSYIEDEDTVNSVCSPNQTDNKEHVDRQDELLPGEVQVNEATLVHLESIYDDGHSGVVGSLICTNFRVLFHVLSKRAPDATEMVECQHYKLPKDNDLVLCNISTIYQVNKGRRKKLTTTTSGLSHVRHIEIRCKNLISKSFNLKTTPKPQVKSFLNALLHHTAPTRLELLFCFDYIAPSYDACVELYRRNRGAGEGETTAASTEMTNYNKREEWDKDLARTYAGSAYKTTDCNKHFRLCPSLPEYFVVPSSLSVEDIELASGQYLDRRVPTWSYTHCFSGSSLLRMSKVIEHAGNIHLVNKYTNAVRESGSEGGSVSLMDLDVLIQFTIHDVRKAYKSLKSICMPLTMKDVRHTDQHWYTKLEDTRWLRIVSCCLSVAKEVVNKMADSKTSIIVVESSGTDFTPIITCLVQLLMDPTLRCSRLLFQRLVDREWSCMGHRFSDRLGLISKLTDEVTSNAKLQSPLFLLFLDCTSQLLNQFPCKFNISENYLTTVYDNVCSGLYSQFIFNNQKHRHNIVECSNSPVQLMSSWQWSDVLKDVDDISLFSNPLFDVIIDGRQKKDAKHFTCEEKKPPKPPRKLIRQRYVQSLGAEYIPSYTNTYRIDQVLQVEFNMSSLKFWSYFFLRWLTPTEISCGGGASEHVRRLQLSDEISSLREECFSLEEQLGCDTSHSRGHPVHSGLKNKVTSSRVMSSSYPFNSTSALSLCNRQSVTVGTYLTGGTNNEALGLGPRYHCSRTNSEDSIANLLDSSTRNSYDNSMDSPVCLNASLVHSIPCSNVFSPVPRPTSDYCEYLDTSSTPSRPTSSREPNEFITPTRISPVFKQDTSSSFSPLFKDNTPTRISPVFKQDTPRSISPVYQYNTPARISPVFKEVNPPNMSPFYKEASKISLVYKDTTPIKMTPLFKDMEPPKSSIRTTKQINNEEVVKRDDMISEDDMILHNSDRKKSVDSLFNTLGWKDI